MCAFYHNPRYCECLGKELYKIIFIQVRAQWAYYNKSKSAIIVILILKHFISDEA